MSLGSLVGDLRFAVASERVHTDAFELGLYGRDASTLRGEASVVCFPTSCAEVSAVVRVCRNHSWPFVARGSGTGLAGVGHTEQTSSL